MIRTVVYYILLFKNKIKGNCEKVVDTLRLTKRNNLKS